MGRSIWSHHKHLTNNKMRKILALAFLSALIAVISADQQQNQELDLPNEKLDNINTSEVSRTEREADPSKRKKGRYQRRLNKVGQRTGKKDKSISKKGKKNGKQGSRRSKKISKKRSKGGRKQRKSGRKPRKGRRKKIKANKSPRNGCSRDVSTMCVETAVGYMSTMNNKVINYLKQQKRIAKFNSTRGKKSGKKGLFGPIASKVIDVGGGNASDLSCSGNKTSEGAAKIKEIIANLSKCEKDIHAACDVSAYPIPNKTEADACVSNMESMKKSVDACTKKSGSEACSCWLDSTLKAYADEVKKCNIASENKRVTSQHKKCTSTFSDCKKVEDATVDYIYACSQSANHLKVKAAQTKKNVNALEAAKTKTGTLAGNSTGRNTVIRKRATSVSTCGDFVSLSAKLLAAADEAPTSSAVETMAKILSAVSDSLSCSTMEKSTLTVQVTTYTQTISKVSATYEGLKATIEDAVGPTTDAEIEAAVPGETTKKTAANRNRLVKTILNNLL